MLAVNTLSEIVSRLGAVPRPPKVLHALLDTAAGSQEAMESWCAMIGPDPALTLRVLRVANAPQYGLQGSVLSLDDASVVLGTAALRTIALTAALMAPFENGQSAEFDRPRLWRHALASALLAQSLADQAAAPRSQAFAAGLLHSLGMLALSSADPALFDRMHVLANERGISLTRACRDHFDWTPAQLGAALARQWALPDTLCEVIEHFRHPPASRPKENCVALVDLVHWADRLAHLLRVVPMTLRREDFPTLLATSLAAHPLDGGVRQRFNPSEKGLFDAILRSGRELQRLEALLG
jgi:HD-like signal output (HDOD) protein